MYERRSYKAMSEWELHLRHRTDALSVYVVNNISSNNNKPYRKKTYTEMIDWMLRQAKLSSLSLPLTSYPLPHPAPPTKCILSFGPVSIWNCNGQMNWTLMPVAHSTDGIYPISNIECEWSFLLSFYSFVCLSSFAIIYLSLHFCLTWNRIFTFYIHHFKMHTYIKCTNEKAKLKLLASRKQ